MERRRARLVIAAGFLVRAGLAAFVGLGVDEAYTLAVSRSFQLSFFDHPPMALWMAWALQRLLGSGAPNLLLRLPFLLLFCASSGLLYRLTERLYGGRAALWALISLTLAPFFSLSAGGWIVPDGPLVFFLLFAANLLVRILFEEPADASSTWLWAGAGTAIGLAGLSKYHALFFAAGVLFFLVLSGPHRRWLGCPGPWLAASLALLAVTPVLVWNARHDWCSFAFQLGRGAPRDGRLHLGLFAEVLGGQAIYLLPWTFVGMIVAAWLALRRRPRPAPDVLLLCVSLPIIVVLTFVPLFGSRGLPHWEMPGWLFLFPLLGRWIAELEARGRVVQKVTLRLGLVVAAVLVLGGGTQARYGWLRRVLPDRMRNVDPTHELLEWRGLREALAGLPPDTPVVSTHWRDGGRIARELPRNPLMVWTDDPRGFAFLRLPEETLGRDVLILGRGESAEQLAARYGPFFEAMVPLPPIPVGRAGQEELLLGVARGVRQKRVYPQPYGERR